MRSPRRRRVHPTTMTLSCSAMSSGAGEPDPHAPAAKRFIGDGADDVFDWLPDDIVLTVLARLAAAADSPADIASASLACRRFRDLAAHPTVLSRASAAAVAVRRAAAWSDAAHAFLRRCAAAGSLHACYFLGMVGFYCLGRRDTGAALLARAAWRGHAPAMYALAVVMFNGSGGKAADQRDRRGGVALCARAAWLGHAPALRELGHCLQDGYGAPRHAAAGRRLLLHAATLEHLYKYRHHDAVGEDGTDDAASRFMVDWWEDARRRGDAAAAARGCVPGREDGELQMCTHARCGRRETRRHEFRRCAVCGAASYCSRACQALDWKRAHRTACAPARWLAVAGAH